MTLIDQKENNRGRRHYLCLACVAAAKELPHYYQIGKKAASYGACTWCGNNEPVQRTIVISK